MTTAVPPSLQPFITRLTNDQKPPHSPRRRTSAFARRASEEVHSAVSPRTKLSECIDNKPHSRSTSFAFAYDPFASKSSMSSHERGTPEEEEPLHKDGDSSTLTANSRQSEDSISSGSTASLVLENLNSIPLMPTSKGTIPMEQYRDDDSDPETPRYSPRKHDSSSSSMSRNLRRMLWIISMLAVAGWALALITFLVKGRYKHSSKLEYDHQSPVKSTGKKVTLESVQNGAWSARHVALSWTGGVNGEDGLLLENGNGQSDFLYVEDIRSRMGHESAFPTTTLMKSGWFMVNGQQYYADVTDPSYDMKKVLVAVQREKQWRHSYLAKYFIFDVETQTAEPLDPDDQDAMVQLALWSPSNDAIVFARDNNLYLRSLSEKKSILQITKDGGPEYFYGVPDWTYEEEVFQDRIATWWARDGKYVAFLRTNETQVPEYPVQYFLSRPSGTSPEEGQEAYPEVRQIKYPKAGAPNPFVDMLFYDVDKDEVFSVDIAGGFADDNRIISECVWADNNLVMVRELNRESDKERFVLVDVANRSGKTVRTVDYKALDGGWVEPAQLTQYIPADPKNGRPQDGYIDTVIYQGYDHLGYFTPLDNPNPIMLTSGKWEISGGVQALDLLNNLVYFTAAKQSPTERHPYSVKLDGTGLQALAPTDKKGYFDTSFSTGGGFALLSYQGPGIPSQKLISTPSNAENYEETLEENKKLAKQAAEYELPHIVYSTVTIDGYELQVMERRPPHFDETKKYPVLFQQYSGPGSQTVNQKFQVDFQSYVASSLGYVVVTVDGRGTGYIGRKARVIVRGNLGHYESSDQISTAKIWSEKSYVDADRIAIWGWSYGGFMTLKTLEQDAGQTFKYGMAVAPVTDWRFYDSIYTERYMMMPQKNQAGYESSAINNITGLAQNVRFLIMHGVADDNVHMQNTLTLLDKLDLAQIDNYDVHFFPDSDHSIYFHNANNMVYEKLSKWLVNAFNGEFYKIEDPVPDV